MAEKYIVNMPQKTTPDDTDLMIIEDAQDTKRMTWANVVKPVGDLIDTVDNTVASHLADKTAHGNSPYAKLFLAGAQSIPNNTATKIAFNTIQGNTDLMADTINSTFVIKTAGTYLIYGFVCFIGNSVGERALFLFKNDSIFSGAAIASVNAVNTLPFVLSIPLLVGDTIDLRVRQQSGGALDVLGTGVPAGSRTQMSILRIGG